VAKAEVTERWRGTCRVEMATEHILRPGYDFGDEFEFGLNTILDALTRSTPGQRP
jgi:hypothetical protein